MRRSVLLCSLLGSVALTSCSSTNATNEGGDSEGPIGTADSAIAYGSTDLAHPHTAVVALLGNAGGGSFDECSGTVVQVKNGQAYVLTAAHCCNMTVPNVVVAAADYSVGENAVLGGAATPPTYAVTAGSVYYDSLYNQMDHDFCMLKFAAPSGQAVIPVAQPGQDDMAVGVTVEHVGYGVTDTTTNNSVRRTANASVDQSVTALILQSSQGGASKKPGVCEGDSGGPALYPAGVAQTSQMVVGTVSYGNASACAQNTMNVCMRVTSETGPGGFITNFLADAPSGTAAGGAASDCNTCATSSESGACKTQASACANDAKCTALDQCLGGCTTAACQTACQTTAGATATNELNAFDTCVCSSACTSECASECGGSTTTGTGGGTSCGLTTNDATCDACINGSCCAQATACANDSNCITCLEATPPCTTDPAATALNSCLNSACATACGGGSSTTGSSSGGTVSGTTGSTSGGANTTSSGGTGASGTGTGLGVGGGGTGASTASEGSGASGTGGSNNQSSGCSISTGETSDPASSTGLAGLLLGAALAFSRRRRA